MSDNTPAIAIGIVAVITALGTACAMICKTIKKSDCLGMHVESRTPPPIILNPPSPLISEKQIKTNIIEEISV